MEREFRSKTYLTETEISVKTRLSLSTKLNSRNNFFNLKNTVSCYLYQYIFCRTPPPQLITNSWHICRASLTIPNLPLIWHWRVIRLPHSVSKCQRLSTKESVNGHAPLEKTSNIIQNVITTKLLFINQCVHSLNKWSI